MSENTRRGFEGPGTTAESSDDHFCPSCGEPICSMHYRGLEDATVYPCGCRVPGHSILADDSTRQTTIQEADDGGLLIPDGGEPSDENQELVVEFTQRFTVKPPEEIGNPDHAENWFWNIFPEIGRDVLDPKRKKHYDVVEVRPADSDDDETDPELVPDGGQPEIHSRRKAIWREKAEQNVERWGLQDIETLLLAMQEEQGELAQAYLEAQEEDGDPGRIWDELDDLAALCIQLDSRLQMHKNWIDDREVVPRDELEQTGENEHGPAYACPRCDYQFITEFCDCPECGWAGMCQPEFDADRGQIEVDGATVRIGDTTILVSGEHGDPLSLDHVSEADGYASYEATGDGVTLRFMEVDDDE